MDIRLRNTWEYLGDDKWRWSVFVDDNESGDLDKISHVQYVLHPTFANPRKTVKDRQSKFKLTALGWGVFNIKAFVNTKGGKRIKLEHYLELYYEPEDGVTD